MSRHTSNDLIQNPNEIIYKCNNCNTVFHNIPLEQCLFCNKPFNYAKDREYPPDPNENDYILFSG